MVALASGTRGPIVELGAGGGALTRELVRLGRPLTAVELDPGRAAALRREFGGAAVVVEADLLRWPLPREPPPPNVSSSIRRIPSMTGPSSSMSSRQRMSNTQRT